MPRNRHARLPRAAMLLLSATALIMGLGFLAYPVIMEMVASHDAEVTISEIEAVYDSMSDAARQENVNQAHAFNDRLLGRGDAGNIWDYDTQLTYHEQPSSMMAWIEIPKIGLRLPVYHHATEAVLMAGVGHVDTTCLPVGGEGTLCALSGHSGMRDARMFDDIRSLEVGDGFVLWTMGDPYAYSVCDVRTVDPGEVGLLEPQPGRDLVALVTCTPINVNTHRLVVMAERCPYEPDSEPMQMGTEAVANRRNAPLLVAVAATVVVLSAVCVVGVMSARRRRGRRRRRRNDGR